MPSGDVARPGLMVPGPDMESCRVRVWVRGDTWGISCALGCSVPMEVMPVSEALPAFESA